MCEPSLTRFFPLAAQTGGSTIRPGAYNNIFALKPTWNAISREGLKIYSLTCDTLGLYARSAEDLELLAGVFALEDDVKPEPTPLPLKGAKFGFLKTPVWTRDNKAGPGLVAAWDRAAKLLEEQGAIVEHIELPESFDKLAQWHAYVLFYSKRRYWTYIDFVFSWFCAQLGSRW